MPFHVRITEKNSTDDEVKLDFTEEQLISKVVDKYEKGESIVISGKAISPSNIERIRINYTEESSEKLIPIIQEEQARKKYAVAISIKWYVAERGEEITDKYIKGPPGKEGVESSGDGERPTATLKFPEKVTFAWLWQNVSAPFGLKVFGVAVTIFALGVGAGQFSLVQQLVGKKGQVGRVNGTDSSLNKKIDLEIFYDGTAVSGKTVLINEYSRFIIPLQKISIKNSGNNSAKDLSIKIHFSKELKRYKEQWETPTQSTSTHGWSISNSSLEGYVSLLEFNEKISLHPDDSWSRRYLLILNFDNVPNFQKRVTEIKSISAKLSIYFSADRPKEVDLILQPEKENE